MELLSACLFSDNAGNWLQMIMMICPSHHLLFLILLRLFMSSLHMSNWPLSSHKSVMALKHDSLCLINYLETGKSAGELGYIQPRKKRCKTFNKQKNIKENIPIAWRDLWKLWFLIIVIQHLPRISGWKDKHFRWRIIHFLPPRLLLSIWPYYFYYEYSTYYCWSLLLCYDIIIFAII